MSIKPALILVTVIALGHRLEAQADKDKPTKDAAVKVLRDFVAALEVKEYEKAALFLHFPPDLKIDVKRELPKFLELKEISKKGVEVLAEKGTWGKLAEVFEPQNAERRAKRAQVPLDACYGLGLNPAEAGFYWTGKQFKIIRANNIGQVEGK